MSEDSYELSLLYIKRNIIHRSCDPFHISLFIPTNIFIYYIICFNDLHK